MTDTDIAAAARRVAAHARYADEPMRAVLSDDLRALLPVLEAVAAESDADRVERWAKMLCFWDGQDPERGLDPSIGAIAGRGYMVPRPMWKRYEDRARAVIALADAERAAG